MFAKLPVALGSVDEEVVDGNALLVFDVEVEEYFVVVEVEIFEVVEVVSFVLVVWCDVVVGVV